ncbi:MAG: tRNA pseudouridine(55) synthase TruB [Verrucomicrobiota bacterium]|nr:tRNA pseudouridine(55) synthase TruB [Verrucomicrobiota bacterium]
MTRQKRTYTDISGILLVDKDKGWTSFDAVNLVKRRFNIKKVGHCGTLDPLATGLLVLVLGKATKLAATFSGADKSYEASIKLGQKTSTLDAEGEVTEEKDCSFVTQEKVLEVLQGFKDEQFQIPPMFSAIKKDGVPLYKLARKGKIIEREPRKITIHELELTSFNLPLFSINVHCSKGTYIRTLADDIGTKLTCGAYLNSLRRTASGEFDISKSNTTETIKKWKIEDLEEQLLMVNG